MEGAGVALAIMPLLISAVEDFGGVRLFLHRITNYRMEALRLLRLLNAEHVRFRCTCETLLQDIVLEDQTRDFMTNLRQDAWESIVSQASQRFQDNSHPSIRPFHDLFDLTVDALNVLREKMKVGSDYEVSRSLPLFLSESRLDHTSRLSQHLRDFLVLSHVAIHYFIYHIVQWHV